jgi:hypothetical protein|tara:strand:+ start:2587 stop:2829 length:243 start_codon:yes stop_codon:yes gene_type:complete
MSISYYDDSPAVKQLVQIGRTMIALCEKNELFPDDDAMWNAAVVCGNKLTTIGTTWSRINSIADLQPIERKALQTYLENK